MAARYVTAGLFAFASIVYMVILSRVCLAQPNLEYMPIVCGPTAEVITAIENNKKEKPLNLGVNLGQRPFVFYGNIETGTWTAVLHKDAQNACIINMGVGLEFAPPALPGQGA